MWLANILVEHDICFCYRYPDWTTKIPAEMFPLGLSLVCNKQISELIYLSDAKIVLNHEHKWFLPSSLKCVFLLLLKLCIANYSSCISFQDNQGTPLLKNSSQVAPQR